MARILQPCNTNLTGLKSNTASSPTMIAITVPLDNEHSPTRSCQNTNDPPAPQPDKKIDSLPTSLPFIFKSDDESCLDLDNSHFLPTHAHSDTPPPVPAKLVTATTPKRNNDNFSLHDVSSPQHQFLTPPSSPVAVNYIPGQENEYCDGSYDDDDGDGMMVLSPPPSAESFTTEFNSFIAPGAVPEMVDGIQNRNLKQQQDNSHTGSHKSNTSTKQQTIQEQKLPVLPQPRHQLSLPSKKNLIQDMHTGRSKSLPSLELGNSKSTRPSPATPQSLSSRSSSSPSSSSSFASGGTKNRYYHPVNAPTTKTDMQHANLGTGKQSPPLPLPSSSSTTTSPPIGIGTVFQQGPMIPDGMYYPDSSLYAASITEPAPHPLSLAPHHPRFPPATLENLNNFRREAQASPHDAALQLNFAKFLMEAVDQARIDDVIRATKVKTAMLAEAQRIVKTVAMMQSNQRGKSGGSTATAVAVANAQFYLANAYGAGLMLLRVDHTKAFHLYLQGTKQSHPACTYRAGVCYELGLGTRRDSARAIRYYRKAANLGDPPAMYKLAIILLHGLLGQSKHPKEAIAWLKKAAPLADAYHPEILHELGLAYEQEGVPSVIPDQDYTCELLTKAARFGYAPSQFKLGMVYENGLWGCPMDARRSIAWYAKAAEQGHLESALALSGWYLTGAKTTDGINILPQNDVEAYLWAKKVAEAGYAKGQYACGYYCETGIGVDQNLALAIHWYGLAAQQQYVKAITRLDELKQNHNTTTTINTLRQQQQQQQRINKHHTRLSLQTSQSYLAKSEDHDTQQQRRHSIHGTAAKQQRPCHSQLTMETTAASSSTVTPRSSMEKNSGCQIM